LEFSLPYGLGDASLPMSAINYESPTSVPGHSVTYQRETRSKVSSFGSKSPGDKWTPEEDEVVRRMRRKGCSWDEIQRKLPHRSKGTIQVRYSTKLK
jgi:hypothetical protein